MCEKRILSQWKPADSEGRVDWEKTLRNESKMGIDAA